MKTEKSKRVLQFLLLNEISNEKKKRKRKEEACPLGRVQIAALKKWAVSDTATLPRSCRVCVRNASNMRKRQSIAVLLNTFVTFASIVIDHEPEHHLSN